MDELGQEHKDGAGAGRRCGTEPAGGFDESGSGPAALQLTQPSGSAPGETQGGRDHAPCCLQSELREESMSQGFVWSGSKQTPREKSKSSQKASPLFQC